LPSSDDLTDVIEIVNHPSCKKLFKGDFAIRMRTLRASCLLVKFTRQAVRVFGPFIGKFREQLADVCL